MCPGPRFVLALLPLLKMLSYNPSRGISFRNVFLNDRLVHILRLDFLQSCEMRLLSDSTLCMVETFAGPAPDSRIRLFDAEWHELTSTTRKPAVHEFLEGDIDEDVRLALEALPLIKASLSEEGDSISFELQTSELTREQQKKAEGKLHSLKFSIK